MSGTTRLDPGSECTVGVSRVSAADEGNAVARLAVVMNGIQTTVALSGSASGFPQCASIGSQCPDQSVYIGTYSGRRTYVKSVSTSMVTVAQASAACRALGSGWDIPISADNNTYFPNLYEGVSALGVAGKYVWTSTAATGNTNWTNHNTTIMPDPRPGYQSFNVAERNTAQRYICIFR